MREIATAPPLERLLLTNREVRALTGKSRSDIRNSVRTKRFPAPIHDGGRRCFLTAEVKAWLEQRAAARPS
jgi:predicted DNA-binding transcriptional regulator AlpA